MLEFAVGLFVGVALTGLGVGLVDAYRAGRDSSSRRARAVHPTALPARQASLVRVIRRPFDWADELER